MIRRFCHWLRGHHTVAVTHRVKGQRTKCSCGEEWEE